MIGKRYEKFVLICIWNEWRIKIASDSCAPHNTTQHTHTNTRVCVRKSLCVVLNASLQSVANHLNRDPIWRFRSLTRKKIFCYPSLHIKHIIVVWLISLFFSLFRLVSAFATRIPVRLDFVTERPKPLPNHTLISIAFYNQVFWENLFSFVIFITHSMRNY